VPSRGAALRDGKTLVLRSGQSAAAVNPPQYTISGWRAAGAKPGESPPTAAAARPHEESQSPPPPVPAGPVDLNTATKEMLEALPVIGPKTAEKIIAYRARTPFRTVDDLKDVAGIGEKKLEAIRSLVTVQGAPPTSPSSENASAAKKNPHSARGDR